MRYTAKILFTLFFTWLSLSSGAQMCPGGGVDFSSAVMFNPSWIYGCNTGTSCNGGTNFNNQLACQPTIAMDACAPAPSCGSSGKDASNIWFKFYPLGPTVTISCFQNSSLVIGIQAFSGGPACGSLTEIGCARSGGPSSGVQLALSGLVPGQLYYFRIFGSATPVSQRTGIYCFCGTTGLYNVALPVSLAGFRGFIAAGKIDLEWTTATSANYLYFEVQRSGDGIAFADIARVDATGPAGNSGTFTYSDDPGSAGNYFYRLKLYTDADHYTYSAVIGVRQPGSEGLRLLFDADRKELQVTAAQSTTVAIINASGGFVKALLLAPGRNRFSLASLAAGVYFLYDRKSNTARRFVVL